MSLRRVRTAAATVLAAGLLGGCGHGLYLRPPVPACAPCGAEAGVLDSRIILLGDAGEDRPDGTLLPLLSRVATEYPARTLVVFLGDNVYPRGMPVPADETAGERARAERILAREVDAVRDAGARAVFVPGNHDWDRGGGAGLERVRAAQRWLARHAGATARQLPRDGCPGPAVQLVGARARLVVLDTEWLLAGETRARATSGCVWGPKNALHPYDDGFGQERVYEAVRAVLEQDDGRFVIVAAHHPIFTRGSHGGFVPLQHWLFPLTKLAKWLVVPLPLLYPAIRYGLVRSDQDLRGARNRYMVQRLQALYSRVGAQRAMVVAAGHEHSLQVLQQAGSRTVYLVSGAGAKTEPTGKGRRTMFKHAHLGLMVLDVLADTRVALRVIEPLGPDRERTVLARWIVR